MKNGKSRSIKKQILNVLFLLLLVGLTLYALAKSNQELSFSNIKEFLSSCNPVFIVFAFIFMLLFIVFEGLSVRLIVTRLGHKCKFISSMVYSTSDIYYSDITPGASGGQPASAFYMIRDGIDGGTSSFTLVFNLVGYISAILVVAVVAFAINAPMFLSFSVLSKVLIIAGIFIQTFLLVFFILCMRCHGAVLKVGNGCIRLLSKIKIIKKTEKWMARFASVVDKYKLGYEHMKEHKLLFLEVLGLNVAQRFSQIFIACFVCYAADPSASFIDLVAMQSFVLLGYNSIPLPGGVGAYEYLYLDIYGQVYGSAFVSSSMMVARAISYYISMILCGIVTLVYHVAVTNRRKVQPLNVENVNKDESDTEYEINTEEEDNEKSEQ